MSLDAYDLNIISLQNNDLWKSVESNPCYIDAINDLRSINKMMDASQKTNIIICFPQNYLFQYNYSKYTGTYQNDIQLKDKLSILKAVIESLTPKIHLVEIVYDNSITKCINTEFDAAFMFVKKGGSLQVATKSIGSEQVTTFFADANMVFTTLDFSKPKANIEDFLRAIGLLKDKTDLPTWIHDYSFFDDASHKQNINNANEEISKQQRIIDAANEKLDRNLYFKSILYENGDSLVRVVFDILEQVMNYSLAGFIDEKKEDFKIALPDITFIGEIKGITSNVRSEHISQLDVHCQSYIDGLDEEGKSENVKGILIINPFRNKPTKERDAVHEKQIEVARRNGSLIVTTETLLQMFCGYLEGRITTDRIIDVLKNKIGLLSITDF